MESLSGIHECAKTIHLLEVLRLHFEELVLAESHFGVQTLVLTFMTWNDTITQKQPQK